MIVVLKQNYTENQMLEAIKAMENGGVKVMVSKGIDTTILGAEGNSAGIDEEFLAQLPGVERVMRVSEPYKKANRKYHPDDTVISVGGGKIGGGGIALIAGPCSVESREQITNIAKQVKASGATALRGGAFKPRTSPYAFQGLEDEGINLLIEAKKETGLPIVTEIMNANHLPLFE